eukprot:CFRG2629T1
MTRVTIITALCALVTQSLSIAAVSSSGNSLITVRQALGNPTRPPSGSLSDMNDATNTGNPMQDRPSRPGPPPDQSGSNIPPAPPPGQSGGNGRPPNSGGSGDRPPPPQDDFSECIRPMSNSTTLTLDWCQANADICVSEGTMVLNSTATLACYTAFSGGTIEANPGFVGAIQTVSLTSGNVISNGTNVNMLPATAIVVVNAGVDMVGVRSFGGQTTITNATVGIINMAGGVVRGTRMTIGENSTLFLRGGEAILDLINAANRIQVAGGSLEVNSTGNTQEVSIDRGNLKIVQLGSTNSFNVNGGNTVLTQNGTINTLTIQNGSIEILGGATTIENLNSLGGTIVFS